MADSAKDRALRLLEKRDYGRDELVQKLTEKGYGPEESAAAADHMVELGFINDEEYAHMVARHYFARGFGERRVREELRRRRLDREYWDAALNDAPRNDDAAYTALLSRLRGRAADRDDMRRASAALLRRGFSWDEIRAATERYEREYGDMEEE